MSSKIEKIEAVIQALKEDTPIKQLCADCADYRQCKVSKAITDIHIENAWVTLRCVRCERYSPETTREQWTYNCPPHSAKVSGQEVDV